MDDVSDTLQVDIFTSPLKSFLISFTRGEYGLEQYSEVKTVSDKT